jgi:uncharacterized protein (TIGR02246 family)
LFQGVAAAIFSPAALTPNAVDLAGLRQAFDTFIHAFNDLDMKRFSAAFSEDATLFTPTGDPRRVAGRNNIEAFFQTVFDETRRTSGRTQPPFMHLDARDLLIQNLDNAAVLTVHLHEPDGSIHRRTFVYQNLANKWEIVHLHASNGPAPAKLHSI